MARVRVAKNIYYDERRNKYYVNLNYGIDKSTGKQIKKMRTFETIGDAEKCLAVHTAEVLQNKFVLPQKITLIEWLDYWINTIVAINHAQTTLYSYENIANHIKAAEIGSLELQKLKGSDIQVYYANLITKKNLSSNTVKKHHNLLNVAFKFAVKQEILQKNPIDSVEAPKTQVANINFYNQEQIQTLLLLSKGHRLELVIHLAAMLGLRREEMLGLKWSCVDFSTQRIEIKEVRTQAGTGTITKAPKTNSSRRTLFFPKDILVLLESTKNKQAEYKEIFGAEYIDDNYVIAWENGTPLLPNYTSELFSKFISHNNLTPITLHGLRHSFATIASAKNIPLYDIGRALGHSDTSTTSKIYTHLLDNGHCEMMDTLWG